MATGSFKCFDVLGGTSVQCSVDGAALEASGTAQAQHVLTGQTFSREGSVNVEGEMADVAQQNVTPGTSAQTITQGYHDGTGEVAGDADLVAANIAEVVTIFGVEGTFEGGGGAGVPKTGQTSRYRDGDDGYHEAGVAWPDPRFTVTTNGTNEVVTDNMTGLMWVRAPEPDSLNESIRYNQAKPSPPLFACCRGVGLGKCLE